METENRPNATKYEVVSGKVAEGTLGGQMRAGYALSYEGEAHYVIRLSMFPKHFYYLTKNRDSQTQYTLFSRRVLDPADSDGVRFLDPVGSARLREDLKSHLELRFPLLGTSVFMSLFPEN